MTKHVESLLRANASRLSKEPRRRKHKDFAQIVILNLSARGSKRAKDFTSLP